MMKNIFAAVILVLGAAQAVEAQSRSSMGTSYTPSIRPRTVGLTGQLSMLNSSSVNQNITTIAADGFFGWNMGNWEAGPKLRFSNVSGGGSSSNQIAVGGYGDFNLVPNYVGQSFVYGFTAGLLLGSESTGGLSGSLTEFELGGQGRWYFSPTSTSAMRFEVVYLYDRSSLGTGNTVSGLVTRVGFQTYF